MPVKIYHDKQGGMWDTWYSADEDAYVAARIPMSECDILDCPVVKADTMPALRDAVESYTKAHPTPET